MFNGRRLRQAREIAGLSREEVAAQTGISVALLTQFETGLAYRPPSAEEESALEHAVGFPASFFHRGEPPDFPLGSLLWH